MFRRSVKTFRGDAIIEEMRKESGNVAKSINLIRKGRMVFLLELIEQIFIRIRFTKVSQTQFCNLLKMVRI